MKRTKRSMQERIGNSSPRLSNEQVNEIGDRVWSRLKAEMAERDLSLRSLYGDGWSAAPLNAREYPVLSAMESLQGESAEGLAVRNKAGELAGNPIGAVSFAMTLRRLSKRGLVTERPGNRFEVTGEGKRALARAHAEGKLPASARAAESKSRA